MSSDIITPQLDPKFYTLAENEAAFFKAQTGIEDEATLKNHIFTIQEEAYKVHPYPCIRRFAFAKLKISRQPCYQQLLNLGKDRKGAVYADIGCCFGNDPRKAVADGFPVEQVIASDLHPEFWELGHRLFKSTAETFPARFIPADIFQLKGLTKEDAPSSIPELFQVQSLAELRGNISAIHTSSFFHLFDEEGQFEIAKIMAALLSSEPGSMIFGLHGGRQEKGLRTEVGLNSGRRSPMFCHSPESWKSLWDGEIYPKGTVRVDAFLHEHDHPEMIDSGAKSYLLVWCITVFVNQIRWICIILY
ncbi:uncharacterized protein EV420DRAFT_1541956 [Desarmillaria tabescens]|uniref:Methyltransferase domain-containing protein n=1 Tax=Armillaria tabescens TaxID=1929756 RepID=A0AA39N5M9_ARMTA|nr:uncharacterized protein EV420DRAFT_1541956 [Desarmillaria tabescens]KAK0459031.1 hypothetical protein EV420DRAFT_1541956 [Desarmillaria tabescens]